MIKLEHVEKYFGDLHVLKDVNLEVAEGEKLVIIGPSGSGKSTTVRCMNFLEEPTSGHVYIDGQELTNKNKTRIVRDNMSMVFQQFNLYPHMTVLKNLTLAPMKLHHKTKAEAEELAYPAFPYPVLSSVLQRRGQRILCGFPEPHTKTKKQKRRKVNTST